MAFHERLKQAMKESGLGDRALATLVTKLAGKKVPWQTVQRIRLTSATSSRYAPEFAEALGVSLLWLSRGEGPMRPAMGVAESKAAYNALSEAAVRIAKKFDKLPAQLKLTAELLMDTLALVDHKRYRRWEQDMTTRTATRDRSRIP